MPIRIEPFKPLTQMTVGVVIGGPGSGKTALVRRLVRDAKRPVFLIDADIGADETLRDMAGEFLHARVRSIYDFYEAVNYAVKLPPEYVIVVDTMSRVMFNFARSLRYKKSGDGDPSPLKAMESADNLTMPEHGKVGYRGEDFWYFCNERKMRHDTILLLHEEIMQDEEGRRYYIAKLPGKAAYKSFPDKFTFIWRAVTRNTDNSHPQHRLITCATETSDTKLRIPEDLLQFIGPEIDHADFGHIYAKYLSPHTPPTTPDNVVPINGGSSAPSAQGE